MRIRNYIKIFLVFFLLGNSSCFGPNEMNPVCWVPVPFSESSRYEKGKFLLKPLQNALEESYNKFGFYPVDLLQLDLRPYHFTLTKNYADSNGYYRFCSRSLKDNECLQILYQKAPEIKSYRLEDSRCIEKRSRREIWWKKTEACAESKGIAVTRLSPSEIDARRVCPERFSDEVISVELSGENKSSYSEDECLNGYKAYSLQSGLEVFCPPHLIWVFHEPGKEDQWKLKFITGK